MASKQVTDREKSARAVSAAAETHAKEIGAGLASALKPYLEKGETMPDVTLLARLLGRGIEARAKALVLADAAHEKELGDDAQPREDRDSAAETVRQVLVDLRAAAEATHGTAGLRMLGLAGAVPVDPSVLKTTADTVSGALRDEAVKLPKARKGMKLDRQSFADELGESLPRLGKALRDVAREAREAEATLAAKTGAMEANDAGFSRAAGAIATLAAAAGLDDLAAKVRPSGRNPGRTSATDAVPPVDGDGPPA